MIRVAAYAEHTRSEGPGERFALWVQGCSIRCPGCCNPEMLQFEGGRPYSVRKLFAMIAAARAGGVSFLGGEPFDQARELGRLAKSLRTAGIGVMVFTGYELRYLRSHAEYTSLLDSTDLLKTGPYVEELHSGRRRWIGSDNQELHFLSDRYENDPDIRPDLYPDYSQSVSLEWTEDAVKISGSPDVLKRYNAGKGGNEGS